MDINQPQYNPAYQPVNPAYQQPRIMPYEPKTKRKFPIVWIIVGVFALALIGFGIFLLTGSSGKISDDDLASGTSVSLKENSQIKFNLNEEEHKITIASVETSSVKLTVQSNPINATLTIGETKKFDFDLNGTYDLSVKLNNITNEKAVLFIKKINELICTENWNCTNWSVCIGEEQNRTCTDLNNCGTTKNKPAGIQACESAPEPEPTSCSEPVETNIDCFIESAADCTAQANSTYDFTSNVVGWVQDSSNYYRIEGFNEGKCELYEKAVSASGNYSDTKRQSLLDEGKTEAQINEMVNLKNENLTDSIGNDRTCRLSTYELGNALNDLKEIGADIADSLCTGPLYGNQS